MQDIPLFVREPLLDIYSKYSEGCVQLNERKWHTFTPDKAFLNQPYFLTKSDEHKTT
jgi:hypothetical protein